MEKRNSLYQEISERNDGIFFCENNTRVLSNTEDVDCKCKTNQTVCIV